jgi:ubiquitin-like 1-activating enzyme E1 B
MTHLNLAQQIATLKKEAQAFKMVRNALRSAGNSDNASRLVFEKVT